MSVFRVTASFLSVKPQVYGSDDAVYCETSLFAHMASLFAYHRVVVADRKRGTVSIETRSWWVRRHRFEVPFDCVSHIEFEYHALPASLPSMGKTDALERFTVSLERFTVSLALKGGGEPVRLATLRGGGARITGMISVLAGDRMVDLSGDQEDASRTYVTALKQVLGVPVGAPLPSATRGGVRYRCQACSRTFPLTRPDCPQCGGPVTEDAKS